MQPIKLEVPDMGSVKSMEGFKDTGRIVPTNLFQDNVPFSIKLHKDCMNVVVYAGWHYIQMLKSGEFLYNDFKSKSLDDVENYLWKELQK